MVERRARVVGTVVILVSIVLMTALAWAFTIDREKHPRNEYIVFRDQCVVDNKELPNPEQYCDALWSVMQRAKDGQ